MSRATITPPMKSTSSNLGAGCLILFALPFAGIGTVALLGFARALMGGMAPAAIAVQGIVGLVFSLFGYGTIVGALTGRKRMQREEGRRAAHPGQPWMWREDWAGRRVLDSSGTGTAFLWVFAILWNAISWPVAFLVPRELEKENYVVLVAAIFPVAGVIILVAAIRGTMRAMRFRRSALVLDHVPVPLGGTLRGRVEVPYEPLAEASSIIVRLTALNRVRSGKSTIESIAFQEELEVARGAVSRMPERVSIPVTIDVPHDLPETEREGSAQTHWRLTVDAEVPGIDYSATFDVPVYRTEVTGQVRPERVHAPPPEPREPVDFVARQTVDGRELYFGRFRARGMAIGTLFLTLIWTVVTAVLFVVDAPFIFPIVFGFFNVLLFMVVLELFFGSTVLVLGRERVVVRHSLFRTKETVLRRDEIASAAAKIAAQGGGRPYYEIEVRTAGGKKISAAKYIRSKREAEWVAAQIRGAIDSPA
jgi:hypothetical protein